MKEDNSLVSKAYDLVKDQNIPDAWKSAFIRFADREMRRRNARKIVGLCMLGFAGVAVTVCYCSKLNPQNAA